MATPYNFTGLYFKFCKTFFKLFTKKYLFKVKKPENAKVYIARHLDMHGVACVLKSANFDTHPLMLNNFFTIKGAFKQYYNYTFSKRFKKSKLLALVPAAVASLFVAPMAKSSGAIPVYRNSSKAFLTLKTTLNYLLNGESVIVFPDIEYTNKSSEIGDIYEGFLLLEKPYFKATGTHLEFIPLLIDETKREIVEQPPVTFSDPKNIKGEIKIVSSKIKKSLNI